MIAFWEKLSKREQKLVSYFLILVLVYGIYSIFINTTIEKLEMVQKDLLEVEERQQQLEQEVAQYNQLAQKYKEYDHEELEKILPQKVEVPETIIWLEGLFAAQGLSKPNIGFASLEGETNYMQVSLSFSGQYHSIKKLIDEIENSPRLITTESTSISGSEDTSSANISLRVFSQDF